jgi:hypothetical protein
VAKRKPVPAPAPAFEPYWIGNPASLMGGKLGRMLVAAQTFCGVRVVYRWANVDAQLGVRDRIIMDHELKNYPRLNLEESALQSALLELKLDMLNQGATPEAVQLFRGVVPLTDEELQEMATKLTKKTTAKAAPAAKATKAAPAAKAKTPKEPKAPAENRKYKHLVKRADIKTREGTWTAHMVDVVMGNKTTDDASAELATSKEYGDRKLDFGWCVKKGYIEFA